MKLKCGRGVVFALMVLASGTSRVAAETGALPDSLARGLEALRSEFEGGQEQIQTLQTDVDKLKRIKISGYLQVRYEQNETSIDTVRVSGSPYVATPLNTDRWYIRRGRLKLTYDAHPLSQGVIYFDGGADRQIRLLEAYLILFDPWTPEKRHQLMVGQFGVPFGYELERSASARELPERSRAENVLFAGERDRGVKLTNQWTDRLETTLALLNGGGVNHPDFPNTDPTGGKDIVGRVRASSGPFEAAVSYYNGINVVPLTGPDIRLDKTRLGVDAQYYYELPRWGGGSLRAEVYTGAEVNPDSVRALIVAPTSARPVRTLKAGADREHLASDVRGGYVMWVQNLGDRLQLAARYDRYDPNTETDHDQFERYGFGLNWFYDGYTRITLAYDIPKTDVKGSAAGSFVDPHDNLLTLQFQLKY